MPLIAEAKQAGRREGRKKGRKKERRKEHMKERTEGTTEHVGTLLATNYACKMIRLRRLSLSRPKRGPIILHRANRWDQYPSQP